MRSPVITGGEEKGSGKLLALRFMGEVTAPEKRGRKEEERIFPPNCEAPLGRALGFNLHWGSRPRNPIHCRNFSSLCLCRENELREPPDMMFASEGRGGSWNSRQSKGVCVNFILQIRSKCRQGKGGQKFRKEVADIISGSFLIWRAGGRWAR